MTNDVSSNKLETIIKKFMNQKKIHHYKWEIEGQVGIGENYTGEVIFFSVISDDDDREFQCVMKVAKRSTDDKELLLLTLLYNRELFAYTEVFPNFKKYIDEHNSELVFDIVPEIYWSESQQNEEILILENMKTRGYRLWERTKPWDLQHSLLVMRKYGELHALSFALKSKKPEVFEELQKNLTNIFVEFSKLNDVENFYGGLWKSTLKVLEGSTHEDVIKKFDGFDTDILNVMLGTAEESTQNVVCHGDCWSNNFMFKYQDDNIDVPSNACLLDFQIIVVDSPVKDLSANIFSTCDKTCLDKFDLLMETYYSSLSRSVEKLGCNIENIFTYEDLMQHWKKYAKFGLILSTELLKAALVDKTDLATEDGQDMTPYLSISRISKDGEYKRRVLDLLTHYSEKYL